MQFRILEYIESRISYFYDRESDALSYYILFDWSSHI